MDDGTNEPRTEMQILLGIERRIGKGDQTFEDHSKKLDEIALKVGKISDTSIVAGIKLTKLETDFSDHVGDRKKHQEVPEFVLRSVTIIVIAALAVSKYLNLI